MKIHKILIILFSLLLFFSLTNMFAAEPQIHNYKPAAGYVPDEETAIKIAVAVWSPIYGNEIIKNEKPYRATLKNGVWYVSGSLPVPPAGQVVKGGVAEAEINKDDGRVIRISHGK